MTGTWAHLLPAGPAIRLRDGREWTYQPAQLIAAFHANNGPLAVDWEHAQDHLAGKGEIAPAAGWITQLASRVDGLWAQVEWVDRAAKQIAAGEYQFVSASVTLSGGEIRGIAGAGLVNRPAMVVQPLKVAAADIHSNARALATAAQNYQAEQACLGNPVSAATAVAAVIAASTNP